MAPTIKTAIILAAGKGTRLRDITGNDYPKPLTPIAGKPMIERSIESLRDKGVTRILLGCGHMLESFRYLEKKYGVEIMENTKYEEYGSIYTLLVFRDTVPEAFYLLEADIIYDPAVLEELVDGETVENTVSASQPLEVDDNVYITSREERLTGMKREKAPRAGGGEVMTGIWTFTEGFLQRFAGYCDRNEVDLNEDYEVVLADYSREREPITVTCSDKLAWCEIDNEEHLNYALNRVWPRIRSKE